MRLAAPYVIVAALFCYFFCFAFIMSTTTNITCNKEVNIEILKSAKVKIKRKRCERRSSKQIKMKRF